MKVSAKVNSWVSEQEWAKIKGVLMNALLEEGRELELVELKHKMGYHDSTPMAALTPIRGRGEWIVDDSNPPSISLSWSCQDSDVLTTAPDEIKAAAYENGGLQMLWKMRKLEFKEEESVYYLPEEKEELPIFYSPQEKVDMVVYRCKYTT